MDLDTTRFKDNYEEYIIMLTTWLTTQILPSALSTISGVIFGAIIAQWDKLSKKFFLAKFGPSIKTIYDIIDPILDGSLQGWKDSDIDKVIAMAINVAYDGELTVDEVNRAVQLISQLWIPQIASKKMEKGVIGNEQLAIAKKIKSAIEPKTLDAFGLFSAFKKSV